MNNLELRIKRLLGKTSLSEQDWQSVTELDIYSRIWTDLEGIERLINLRRLSLHAPLSDPSPLLKLRALEALKISYSKERLAKVRHLPNRHRGSALPGAILGGWFNKDRARKGAPTPLLWTFARSSDISRRGIRPWRN